MSTLFLIVRRSLWQHLLSTMLTAVGIALAGGLIMSLFVLRDQAEEAFTAEKLGFDAVLGTRGSPLQLVLNSVFHMENSPGNIPWSLYESIADDPSVELAIPYALGDNYLGYRLIGTTSALFEDLVMTDGKTFELAEGRFFDTRFREVVVGDFAARKTGVKVGDTINPYHGLVYDPNTRHPEEFLVVGILKPTNSPADRVLWMPIEGIYRMEGHVLRGTGEDYLPEKGKAIPVEHKEVSTVMLRLSSPQAGFTLGNRINRQGKVATLAFPIASIMAELFNRLGWMIRVLELVAFLVVAVALASNTAALYNTLDARRRDIAILRALGARRGLIFRALIAEAMAISIIGAAAAFAVYFAIMIVVGQILRNEVGVVLDPTAPHPILIVMPIILALTGALSGLPPAIKAYRTSVSRNLSPLS